MRLDDDYTKIGIKIFFEDNAWKIANENTNQPKGLNQDGKKKLKRQHSQSFLQFDVPPHKSSKSKRQELPSKLFWEVINNEKFQITKLTEKHHGVVYKDLMGLKELEAKKATNCDPLSLCGLSLCKTCETNLIEIKAQEPNEYLSGIYKHSHESKNGNKSCIWNRISIDRYLIYKKDECGLTRDWVITTKTHYDNFRKAGTKSYHGVFNEFLPLENVFYIKHFDNGEDAGPLMKPKHQTYPKWGTISKDYFG